MLEQREILSLKLKVKDVYNLNDVVKVIDEWLKENHFVDLEGQNDYETVYTHALRAGGTFLDAWLWWRALRYPEGTTEKTAFLRYKLNIDMHFLGDAAETEVVSKGKRVKLNKGETSFTITGILEIDFRNEWKEKGILGLVNDVFKKRIYKKEIDQHIVKLIEETYKFQNMLKQFFGLESMGPQEVVSQPPKGLK